MTSSAKDFKVKHGLSVAQGATFGQSITIGAPTSDSHAATKSYVDSLLGESGGINVGDTEPASPTNGMLWLDTSINRLKIYKDAWITLATYEDAESVTQHVHDTSIDGTGFVTDTFTSSPEISEPAVVYLDGGSPSDTEFDLVLDGGTV